MAAPQMQRANLINLDNASDNTEGIVASSSPQCNDARSAFVNVTQSYIPYINGYTCQLSL